MAGTIANIAGRFRSAWSVFAGKNESVQRQDLGPSYMRHIDRPRLYSTTERTMMASVLTRIAVDVSDLTFMHCKVDEGGYFKEPVLSGLNFCLNVEANIDQAATHLIRDLVTTMFDKGTAAIVAVDISDNPDSTGSYDVYTLRIGTIIEWFPRHVRVELYNDRKGQRETITIAKEQVAIVENPFYTVFNEPNSTYQRLIRKLSLLDVVDEQSSSGKLDLIIQLPYVIKSEARRQQAEARRKDIELQLRGSQYGIAYTDGTERITQLNRPAENDLLRQVEYLTGLLYAQLGVSAGVFDGTADEKVMLAYQTRTVKPVAQAIVEALDRTFLTKTARTQGHAIRFLRDPFALVTVAEIADIADKFTRNEIASSNEIRSFIGMRPSKDPAANELRNKNMPAPEPPKDSKDVPPAQPPTPPDQAADPRSQNGT